MADLDHETTATYSVTVTATDTAGATGTIDVTIDVNNLDEPGTVTLSSPQPLVAIRFTATLDDPDNVSGRETWSWARSQSGASDWDLHQRRNFSHLYAGFGRCGRLPAGHCLLHRWRRVGQERPGHLRHRRGAGAGKERAGLYGWSDRDAQHPEEHARGRGHRQTRLGHRRRQRRPDLQPGRQHRRGLFQH